MAFTFEASQLWESMRLPYPVPATPTYPKLEGHVESFKGVAVASPVFTRPNALCTVAAGKTVSAPALGAPALAEA